MAAHNKLVTLMCVKANGISNSTQKLCNFVAYYGANFIKLFQFSNASIPALLKSVDGSLPWNPTSFQCSPYLKYFLFVKADHIYFSNCVY